MKRASTGNPYVRPHPIRRRLKNRARELIKGDRQAVVLHSLPADGAGAEIGVWKGDMSAKLLRRVQPRSLLLVDPWAYSPQFGDSLFGGVAARSQADMDAICDGVRERFSGQIAAGTVRLHRGTSVQAAAAVPDGSLDWVYIDGNHAYEYVTEDLRTWYPKLRAGGLLTGDDYGGGPVWWQDGVTRAVMEFVCERPVVAEVIYRQQYVLRKASPD